MTRSFLSELKGDAAFGERRRAGVISVLNTPSKYKHYRQFLSGSQPLKEACPCSDSNRNLNLRRRFVLSIELQGHAENIVARGTMEIPVTARILRIQNIVRSSGVGITTWGFPPFPPRNAGSRPVCPTANRLGSLAQQRGGKAVTLGKHGKSNWATAGRDRQWAGGFLGWLRQRSLDPSQARNLAAQFIFR